MMKKSIFSILAVLTVFAMVMTGCPETESSVTPEVTYTVTFDSKGGSEVESKTAKSGSTITSPQPNPTHTETGLVFLGWYKDEECTPGQQWSFTNDKVTKDLTLYARWGRDATLKDITIDNEPFLDLEGASYGMAGDTLAEAGWGTYESTEKQPAGGVAVNVTAKATGAEVKWVKKVSEPTDAEFTASTNNSTTKLEFGGDNLYIRITSTNGANDPYKTVLYYKINVFYGVIETINYGQPSLDGGGGTNGTVDDLWGDTTPANYKGPVFDLSRLNRAEVPNPAYRFLNTVEPGKNHTEGTAKAYWDDFGLYVYATIIYHDYYEDETAKNNNTSTPRVTNMRGNFESDSFEIMVNTRAQLLPDDNDTCIQYRVGFSNGFASVAETYTNKYGTFTIGGNLRGNPLTPELNARHIFGQTLQYNAWITKDGTGKETGYKVIAHVPWALIGNTRNGVDETSDVFGTDGKVKDNAKIGLDMQINAATDDGRRDAILTCSSVSNIALANTKNYAKITLAPPTGGTRPIETNYPTIDGNSPPTLAEDGQTMKIPAYVAPANPTASLSYQWWSGSTATDTGAAIATGGTGATYKPADISAATGTFFWVVVTNTNSAAATGKQTASVTSRRFQYAPVDTSAPVEVWKPTITTATALEGSGEYVGQTGIKRDSDATEIAFGVIADGFTVTVTSGTYKQFCIQVGTAAGGSNYYTTNGFVAATGTAYTVTFKASVETGTGQLRASANNNTSTWAKTQDLTTTPTEFKYSWTQGSGNLKFDTGNTAVNGKIIITDIKITTP